MSDGTSQQLSALHQMGQSWRARTVQERTLLLTAGLLVLSFLILTLLIKPALRARAQLAKDLPVLRQQAAQLQSLSQQAAELSRSVAPVVPAMSKESIIASLTRSGLTAQSVVLNGDFAKLQLSAVSFASLLNWLDDMQKTARISVMEANVSALPVAGSVNVILTLRQYRPERY